MAIPVGRLNSLQQLVDRVGVSEDVVGRFPIGVLVGSPKARYPKRRCIRKRSTEIGRRGPLACGSGERIDYFGDRRPEACWTEQRDPTNRRLGHWP